MEADKNNQLKSYDDIRDLRDRIKQMIPNLSKNQKKIANYIVENPEKLALSSIRELEDVLGISKSTIVRLTQSLGYRGFQELRSAFIHSFRRELDPLNRYKAFLSQRILKSNSKIPRYLRMMADETVENIHHTLQLVDAEQYEKCLAWIKDAHCVFTMGSGLTSYLADMAAYLLSRVSIPAKSMNHIGLTFVEQVIHMSSRDLILAFSFPSYSSNTIEGARYAREKKIKVIAITDKATSEIIAHSDLYLQVAVKSTSISNSITPVFVLLHSMATQIGHQLKARMLRTLKEYEDIRSRYNTDIDL